MGRKSAFPGDSSNRAARPVRKTGGRARSHSGNNCGLVISQEYRYLREYRSTGAENRSSRHPCHQQEKERDSYSYTYLYFSVNHLSPLMILDLITIVINIQNTPRILHVKNDTIQSSSPSITTCTHHPRFCRIALMSLTKVTVQYPHYLKLQIPNCWVLPYLRNPLGSPPTPKNT